jgi:hypothetical protein
MKPFGMWWSRLSATSVDRGDHDADLVDGADRGDHGVQRETRSKATIWAITAPNDAATRWDLWPSSPSRRSWISYVALPSRNSPPPSRIRSRPESSSPKTVTSGAP